MVIESYPKQTFEHSQFQLPSETCIQLLHLDQSHPFLYFPPLQISAESSKNIFKQMFDSILGAFIVFQQSTKTTIKITVN